MSTLLERGADPLALRRALNRSGGDLQHAAHAVRSTHRALMAALRRAPRAGQALAVREVTC